MSKDGRRAGLLVISPHIVQMQFVLSLIRQTLEYCAGIWGCCGEVNSGIIETLQKRVGRIVIGHLH